MSTEGSILQMNILYASWGPVIWGDSFGFFLIVQYGILCLSNSFKMLLLWSSYDSVLFVFPSQHIRSTHHHCRCHAACCEALRGQVRVPSGEQPSTWQDCKLNFFFRPMHFVQMLHNIYVLVIYTHLRATTRCNSTPDTNLHQHITVPLDNKHVSTHIHNCNTDSGWTFGGAVGVLFLPGFSQTTFN